MSARRTRAAGLSPALAGALAGVLAGVIACGLAGCRGEPSGGAASSGPGAAAAAPTLAPPASSMPPPAARAPSSAEIEDELSTQPLELLRFQFTSGVEAREPKDELTSARPGQRVYAYLALRNRTGRRKHVTLRFSVEGEERTVLELPVDESWQFRTWGYNTLLPKDRSGKLRLEVVDESGHPVLERELPIRP